MYYLKSIALEDQKEGGNLIFYQLEHHEKKGEEPSRDGVYYQG